MISERKNLRYSAKLKVRCCSKHGPVQSLSERPRGASREVSQENLLKDVVVNPNWFISVGATGGAGAELPQRWQLFSGCLDSFLPPQLINNGRLMRNTENKGQKWGRFVAFFLTGCLFSGVFSFIMHVLHLSCVCSFTWRQERDSELSFHNPIDFHMASPSQQEINCILNREL